MFEDEIKRNRGHRVAFSGDASDHLAGGALDDRLYSMGGNDVLQRGKGNDHLEGGTGFDSYVWNTNDGDDRIIDADRKGRIVINGAAAKLLIQQSETTWGSADGKLTLAHPSDSSGSWKLTMQGGGLDIGATFTDGDIGIYGLAAAPTYPSDPTILGDKAPKDFTEEFPGPVSDANYGTNWVSPRITVTADHTGEDGVRVVDAYSIERFDVSDGAASRTLTFKHFVREYDDRLIAVIDAARNLVFLGGAYKKASPTRVSIQRGTQWAF